MRGASAAAEPARACRAEARAACGPRARGRAGVLAACMGAAALVANMAVAFA